MGIVLTVLGLGFVLASVVCTIIVLIDAFRNEVWKGIVGFLCGLYLLYYAFAEYQGDNKMMLILGMLLGGFVGGGLMAAGGAMMQSR